MMMQDASFKMQEKERKSNHERQEKHDDETRREEVFFAYKNSSLSRCFLFCSIKFLSRNQIKIIQCNRSVFGEFALDYVILGVRCALQECISHDVGKKKKDRK